MVVFRRVVSSFLALAASLVFLASGTVQAQNCSYNPDTGCAFCTSVDGGLCCTSYSCGPDNNGGSCGVCQLTKFNRMRGKEEVILARLMAKDAAIANAVKS
jgi:hypothetical protein